MSPPVLTPPPTFSSTPVYLIAPPRYPASTPRLSSVFWSPPALPLAPPPSHVVRSVSFSPHPLAIFPTPPWSPPLSLPISPLLPCTPLLHVSQGRTKMVHVQLVLFVFHPPKVESKKRFRHMQIRPKIWHSCPPPGTLKIPGFACQSGT